MKSAKCSRIQGRDCHGKFAKGCSGNPAGKKKGCLSKHTRQLKELFAEHSERIAMRIIGQAESGCTASQRLLYDKFHANLRPVSEPLPPGVVATAEGILKAVSDNQITPETGKAILELVELASFEKRLQAIEQALSEK
jgi:hypothetical protein